MTFATIRYRPPQESVTTFKKPNPGKLVLDPGLGSDQPTKTSSNRHPHLPSRQPHSALVAKALVDKIRTSPDPILVITRREISTFLMIRSSQGCLRYHQLSYASERTIPINPMVFHVPQYIVHNIKPPKIYAESPFIDRDTLVNKIKKTFAVRAHQISEFAGSGAGRNSPGQLESGRSVIEVDPV
ncbi:hypothetical protein J6590_092264 [Homalodisca vitripennis]|nr:hypothetical protein J6590_092264 [Homalodisca vitripennis]